MFVRQALGVLAALAVIVAGQDDQDDPTPTAASSRSVRSNTTSASSGPATVTVAVGANGHLFTPNEAKANVGDILKFTFYPAGNNPHRVARAEFGWPCIPYEYSNINKPGFYTGIFAPQVISNDPPSYTIRVNDTDPIFFYCAAPHSCVDYHMIGVINPNATRTLAKQLAFAKNTTYQLMPGEPFPSETPVLTPTRGGGPPKPSSGGSGDGGSRSELSPSVIAGIAIGSVAVTLGVALVYLWRGGFVKAYRKSGLASIMEASCANGAVVGYNPKSLVYAGAVDYSFAGFSAAGQHGRQWYGDGMYSNRAESRSPHALPGTDRCVLVQIPAELPTGEAPGPIQSPPPDYRRDSWSPGEEERYRPSLKP